MRCEVSPVSGPAEASDPGERRRAGTGDCMTVTISRRSWHYRLLIHFSLIDPPQPPRDLCTYVIKLLYLIAIGFPVMACVFLLLSPVILFAFLADYLPETWVNAH